LDDIRSGDHRADAAAQVGHDDNEKNPQETV